jgi:hypothetical protein
LPILFCCLNRQKIGGYFFDDSLFMNMPWIPGMPFVPIPDRRRRIGFVLPRHHAPIVRESPLPSRSLPWEWDCLKGAPEKFVKYTKDTLPPVEIARWDIEISSGGVGVFARESATSATGAVHTKNPVATHAPVKGGPSSRLSNFLCNLGSAGVSPAS